MGFPDGMRVEEARRLFFAGLRYGGDGGYDRRWVTLRAGPIPLAFPNLPARVRAVRLHDLHHVATGYPPRWRGEAEIGAWELAAGCGRYPAAWLLNFAAFTIGLILWPRRLFRAFVRGRSCTTLYDRSFDESLLDQTVGTLRRRLGLDRPAAPPAAGDVLAFAAWAATALTVLALPVAAAAAVLGALP